MNFTNDADLAKQFESVEEAGKYLLILEKEIEDKYTCDFWCMFVWHKDVVGDKIRFGLVTMGGNRCDYLSSEARLDFRFYLSCDNDFNSESK